MTESRQPHSIDAAYAAASDALSDDAARRRRRAALMAALLDADAQPESTASAVQPIRPATVVRSRSNWWNMLAAACVIGLSSLLVLRMQDVDAPVDVPRSTAPAADTADQASGHAESAPAAAPTATAQPEPAIPQVDSRPVAERQAADPGRQPQRRSNPAAARAKAGPADEAAHLSPPESLAIAPPRAFPAEQAEASRRLDDHAAGNSANAADSAPSPPKASRLQSPREQNELSARSAPAGASLGSAKLSPTVEPGWRSDGLIAAVEARDLERIKLQLKTVAADAEKDADGRTALAHAVLHSNLPVVELLLAAGADRSLRDRNGLSPLDHALTMANPAILATLEKGR